MIGIRRHVIASQPMLITLSGNFIHFVTTKAVPLIITGSGNITICGKNIFDPDNTANYTVKNRTDGSGRAVYLLAATNTTMTFSADVINDASHTTGNINIAKLSGETFSGLEMFITPTSELVKTVQFSGSETAIFSYTNTTTATLQRNLKRYYVQAEVGDTQTAFEAYNGTTAPVSTQRVSLIGINNIWSDSGSITVQYWDN